MNIKIHGFISPKGDPSEDFDQYKSRFGFAWWFWIPTMHRQKLEVLNGYSNPRVERVIWLCFAVGLNIGREGTAS